MRWFRSLYCWLIIWGTVICLGRGASASQVIVIVTGTVASGTNGNPNSRPPGAGRVFGGETDLAGQPFTLTLNFDTLLGTSSFDRCPDGSIIQSSNTGSSTAAAPTAVLQIGKGSYLFGTLPLLSIGWTTYRSAPASCTHPYSDIGFGWSDEYTGSYSGGAGFGGVNIYASSTNFASGDWQSAVPSTPVNPTYFQFNIAVSQKGTSTDIAYAYGELKAAMVAVETSSTCSLTANSPSQTGLVTSEPDAFVDCVQKLADLAGAFQNFKNRLNAILAIEASGGTPDKGHLKALDEAGDRLKNALELVEKHCAGTAAAATLIAGAEAALEAAAPYLPYLLCL